MSALARYPVPQAVAAGAVDPSRLYFQLDATVVPAPVLDFLAPLRAPREAVDARAIGGPRLYFRLDAAGGGLAGSLASMGVGI